MRLAILLVLVQAALIGIATALNPEVESLAVVLWGASLLVLVALGWILRSWQSVFVGVPMAGVASLAVVLTCCSGGEEDYIFDKVYDPGPGEWVALTLMGALPFMGLIAIGVASRHFLTGARQA